MHQIVMVLGAVSAVCGVLFFALTVIVGRDSGAAAILAGLGIGGGMLLSGALLYCIGKIVEELIAIRKSNEVQAKALADWLKQPA